MFRTAPLRPMSRLNSIVITTLFSGLLLFTGCDIETNKQRALHAQRNTEMRRLLVALEMFRDKSGKLPSSLDELQKNDPAVRDISFQAYTYSAEGTLVADGTRWLITLADPKDATQLMVGRLPVEVTVRKPN